MTLAGVPTVSKFKSSFLGYAYISEHVNVNFITLMGAPVKYFKNIELAKLYHVSEKTVRNWIGATQDKKLNLELYQEGSGRVYVANTLKNTRLIEALVNKGKKYKNTRGYKIITPKDDFYRVYSNRQILDIILSLTVHRESPLRYGYINGGAEDWDSYTERLLNEESNILTCTIELLDMTAKQLEALTNGYKKINVVDLGPGNGLPVRSTLERLTKEGRLGRYIAIDISQDMLDILEKNIKKWFGGSINSEYHLRDISYERFNDILADDFASEETVNLVLLLGGTLANFRSPDQILQAIHDSLGPNDLLVHSGYLDTPRTRRYFDYYTSDKKVPAQDGLVFDFLNIDDSLYEVDLEFNKDQKARTIRVRPKVDMSIKIELENGMRTIELRKNEPILLWRHRHYNVPDMVNLFDKNDFDLQQVTKSRDQNYVLLASKLKVKNLD